MTALDSPQPLADLVAPTPGAVGRRVLLREPGGTVSLFAFAAGEGLAEHASPRAGLLVVVSGRARVTLGGTAHTLGPGEAVAFPRDAPHAVHAATDLRVLLTLFA